MSIRTFFQQRAYKKKVRDWPERSSCMLEVALDPPAVNGLKFHSHIDEAQTFGRPGAVSVVSSGSIVRLDFLHQGLELEYEDDGLVYIGVVVSPKDDVTSEPDMAPARATLLHGARLTLSLEIKADRIIEIFGSPVDDDQDDEERILRHQINEYTVESEFTPDNGLKRLSVYPT